MSNGKSTLGIGPDGQHDPTILTGIEHKCLNILQDHCGRAAAISALELTKKIYGTTDITAHTRETRRLVNHLIIGHDIPIICRAGTGGGYWLPNDSAEVEAFYQAFHRRAMTGLVKAARGKRAAFVDIVDQLTLWFDDPPRGIQATEFIQMQPPDAAKPPAWVQVITRSLSRMHQDPQKYAAEIRYIQQNYGDVFVPRERMQKIRTLTDSLHALLEEEVA